MDISVVIPAYNSSKYIMHAVESVINQNYPPKEIIIVDDGSEDDTYLKVKTVYPDIILLKQNNRGPASARNLGINRAKSKWIAFLDSDDVWEKNHLRRFHDLIRKETKLNWACSGYAIKYSEDKTVNVIYSGKYYKNGIITDLFKAYKDFKYKITTELISTCAVIINKDFFFEELYFNTSYYNGEDIDLWFRLAIKDNVIGYVKHVGFVYRRINNNSITANSVRSFNTSINNIDRIMTSWSNVPKNDLAIQNKAKSVLNIWVFRELKSIVRNLKFSIVSKILYSNFYNYLSLKNKIIIVLFSIVYKFKKAL